MNTSNYLRICKLNNIPINVNRIGESGESFVKTILTYIPLFNVYFLDSKAPYVDFYCEILDEQEPFPFLIQAKSTTKGTTIKHHLKTRLPKKKKSALLNRPLPTYLAGVDIERFEIYIYPIFNESENISSVPPLHKLACNNATDLFNELTQLKKDVINFWNLNTIKKKSYKSMLLP